MRTLPALLLLLSWLVPHELALVWQPGEAQVELRTRGSAPIESVSLLEPDENPSELRLALVWRF